MTVTYDTLVDDVPKRLMAQNRDWPGELPKTIRKAEERLLLGIHPDALRQDIEGFFITVTDRGSPTFDNTVDLRDQNYFGEIQGLWITDINAGFEPVSLRRILIPKSYDYCVALFAAGIRGVPRYYAERLPGIFEVFPVPVESYGWRGIANLRAVPLSPAVQTNLLTERFPTLLEYACAVEGALWMKDKVAVEIWLSAYTDRLVIENENIRRRRRDETGSSQRRTENVGGAP